MQSPPEQDPEAPGYFESSADVISHPHPDKSHPHKVLMRMWDRRGPE